MQRVCNKDSLHAHYLLRLEPICSSNSKFCLIMIKIYIYSSMTHRRPALFPAASVCRWASRKWKVLTVSPPLGFLELEHQTQTRWQVSGPHFSPTYHRQCLPSHSVAQDVLCGDLNLALVFSLSAPSSCCAGQDMQVSEASAEADVLHCTTLVLSIYWNTFCRADFHLSLATRQSNKVNYRHPPLGFQTVSVEGHCCEKHGERVSKGPSLRVHLRGSTRGWSVWVKKRNNNKKNKASISRCLQNEVHLERSSFRGYV